MQACLRNKLCSVVSPEHHLWCVEKAFILWFKHFSYYSEGKLLLSHHFQQWAAVRIHLSLIREPPQIKPSKTSTIFTWYWRTSLAQGRPLMILFWRSTSAFTVTPEKASGHYCSVITWKISVLCRKAAFKKATWSWFGLQGLMRNVLISCRMPRFSLSLVLKTIQKWLILEWWSPFSTHQN